MFLALHVSIACSTITHLPRTRAATPANKTSAACLRRCHALTDPDPGSFLPTARNGTMHRVDAECHSALPERVHAFTASHGYFTGLAVMLHSLHEAYHRGPKSTRTHQGYGYLLLWSRMEPDSVLTAEEIRLLELIVGEKHLHWREIDAARYNYWLQHVKEPPGSAVPSAESNGEPVASSGCLCRPRCLEAWPVCSPLPSNWMAGAVSPCSSAWSSSTRGEAWRRAARTATLSTRAW